MTDAQLDAVRKVVNYLERDEWKDWDVSGRPDGHIYTSVRTLAGMTRPGLTVEVTMPPKMLGQLAELASRSGSLDDFRDMVLHGGSFEYYDLLNLVIDEVAKQLMPSAE